MTAHWTSSQGFNHLNWPRTSAQWCTYFKDMDARFDTDKRSPLHHDNRCPMQMKEEA